MAPVVPLPTSVKSPGIHLRVDRVLYLVSVQSWCRMMQQVFLHHLLLDFAANDEDERQDEVGLLGPGTSNANLTVPVLVVTSGGGGESGAVSPSSSSRSRTGSSSPRSRAPSSLRSRSSVPVASELAWCCGTFASTNTA